MKEISCCLIAFTLAFLMTVSVYGITLDGDIGAKEWRDATIYRLIESNDESNCNVGTTALSCFTDKESYSLYLGFKYYSEDMDVENNNSAIELSINGSYCATFYANGDEMNIDYDKFDAESIFGFNPKHNETYCEMRVGIKYGIGEETVVGVRVFDYMGRPSNYYEVIICDADENRTEKSEETQKEKETETAVPHKNLSDKQTTASKKHTTAPVITAKNAASPQTETKTETGTVKREEPSATTETAVLNENNNVTKKETQKSEDKAHSETDLSENPTESQSEVSVSRTIDELDVEKQNSGKVVGYSIATALLVSAVFIGVIATVMKSVKKQSNTDNENL